MTPTQTPKTDAVVAPYIGRDAVSGEEANALLDHARQLERELEEVKAQIGAARGELSTAKMLLSVYDETVPRLKGDLEEAKNELGVVTKELYSARDETRRAMALVKLHEAALEKARVALGQHIMRCNWSRHGYGPCTCPHDTRIKEALAAINELNQ